MKMDLQKLRLLHSDQSAQGMVFGAISLFLMAASVGLVHNSGVVVSRRVQAQTAADAAAYAGSLTTANILSDLAWMNDGMAYIYYNMMRYAVDVTVYRTQAELKKHNYYPYVIPPAFSPPGIFYVEPNQPTKDYYTNDGRGDPEEQWKKAYDAAADIIPRGEEWMRVISDMERALAVSGRYLVRDAVYKAAVGSRGVVSENADKDAKTDVAAVAIIQNLDDVFFLNDAAEDVDMYLEYDADGLPLWKITYNGKIYAEIWRLGPDHWRITRPGVQAVDIYRLSDNSWKIKSGGLEATVTKYDDGSIEVNVPGAAHLLCLPLGNNMWAVTGQAAGADISYKPFKDGGYELTVNGATVGVRTQNGKMQTYQGNKWVDLPKQGTVNVGGRDIPINVSNRIDLPGNAWMDFPNTLHLGPMTFNIPDGVDFAGMHVTLMKDTVKISGNVGNVGIEIDGNKDNCAVLNGLSTCDASSATKRQHGQGHDRIEVVIPGKKWHYIWRSVEPLVRTDASRLGLHAVADAERAGAEKNEWASIPELGRRGWFDVQTGMANPITSPPSDEKPFYSLTVPCWNPGDRNHNGYARGGPCPTCSGVIGEDQDNEFDMSAPPDADGRYPILIDKDGDGKSDVRKYGDSMFFYLKKVEPLYLEESTHNPKLKKRGDPKNEHSDRTLQTILVNTAGPMCVTESVFAQPLIVAVWIRPETPFLGSRVAKPVEVTRDSKGEYQAKTTGSWDKLPFFRNPDSGMFSVACARVGVYSSWEDPRLQIAEEPDYRFTFDDAIDKYDFAAADDYDVRAKKRGKWLTSWHNNYEPVWTARLWSMSEALRSVDLHIAWRQKELGKADEVSKNFIWRVLQDSNKGGNWTIWRDPHVRDIVDLGDPTMVFQARDQFRELHNPRGGTFGVGGTTDPKLLEKALQH